MATKKIQGKGQEAYMREMTKIYQLYDDLFRRIFHVPLKRYFNVLTGFDVVKFDVEVIKSRSDEAMIDVCEAKFSREGVNCIEAMMRDEQKAAKKL